MGGRSMKDVGGAVLAGSTPPFLGRERAAVEPRREVNKNKNLCSPPPSQTQGPDSCDLSPRLGGSRQRVFETKLTAMSKEEEPAKLEVTPGQSTGGPSARQPLHTMEKPTALAHRRGVHSLRGLPPQYACSSAPNLSPPAAHECTTCPGGKHHVGPFANTSRRQCEGGQRKEEAKGEKEKRRRIGQRCRAPVRSRNANAASGARCHLQRQGCEGHTDTISSQVTVCLEVQGRR